MAVVQIVPQLKQNGRFNPDRRVRFKAQAQRQLVCRGKIGAEKVVSDQIRVVLHGWSCFGAIAPVQPDSDPGADSGRPQKFHQTPQAGLPGEGGADFGGAPR